LSYPIVGGEISIEAMDEARIAAEKAKRDAEATRAFVLEHFEELRGTQLAVEMTSVANLPSYSCLIVNDHLLLSYVEAEQLIKQLERTV